MTKSPATVMLLTCCCGIASVYGSVITGVSTNATGTSYTVTYNNFATVGGVPGAGQVGMAGMQITANFGNGAQSCTWVNATGCVAAGFTVNFPNISTDPDATPGNRPSALWTITNTRPVGTGNQIINIVFNGIVGLTTFDRCMTGPGTFSDTNSGGNCLTSSGGIEGTTGSNVGWSAATGNGGSAGITATALYANQLRVATQPFQGDAWGSLTLTFAGTAFQGGSNFTFQSDTDSVSTAVVFTPEPATYGMAGLALLAFGLLSKFARRLKTSGPKASS